MEYSLNFEADLVHLGAKFAPCMREDPRIFERIEADHKEENETGCCIYNDGTGCFQTGETTCPVRFTIYYITYAVIFLCW